MNKRILDAIIVHMNNQFCYILSGLSSRSEAVNFMSGYLMALEETEAITEHQGKFILGIFLSLT